MPNEEDGLGNFGAFTSEVRKWVQHHANVAAFLAILTAGVVGGILANSASTIAGASSNTTLSVFEQIGLGFAAAGIGTLVMANTKRDDLLHLFFFAMLCGISFPAVIKNAMAEKIDRDAKAIAAEATTSDAKKLNSAASVLKDTRKNALPSGTAIDVETGFRNGIEAVTETASKSTASEQVIRNAENALQATKAAAVESGFDALQTDADDALERIENAQRGVVTPPLSQ